jgi:hypothetical protein
VEPEEGEETDLLDDDLYLMGTAEAVRDNGEVGRFIPDLGAAAPRKDASGSETLQDVPKIQRSPIVVLRPKQGSSIR